MDKPLKLDGKKFISARRAAENFGYTSDYVGQLCRAKKINARLVGRSWYVLEKDLIDHKNNHHLNSGDLKIKISSEEKKLEKSQTIKKEKNYPKKSKIAKKHPKPPQYFHFG